MLEDFFNILPKWTFHFVPFPGSLIPIVAVTLFHVDWCPDCLVVRRKLTDLGLTYEAVVVPDSRRMRTQVYEASGQYYVPVLKDGDLVLAETADILAYLDERSRTDRAGTAAATEFQSQARTTPDVAGEDDEHPSCRIN